MEIIYNIILSLAVLWHCVSLVNSAGCIGKYHIDPSSSSLKLLPRNLSLDHPFRFDLAPAKTTFENNGHTVVVKYMFDIEAPALLVPSLPDTIYHFEFMQYNWLNESEPDEFPAELHMIFRNDRYNSYQEAFDTDLGTIILSYRHKVEEMPFSDMNLFYEALENIVEPYTKTDVLYPYIPPLYHIGMKFPGFYMYVGKHLYPDGKCNADVIWFEFPYAIPITISQVEHFRNLVAFDGTPLITKTISYPSPNGSIYQAVDLLHYEKKGWLPQQFEGFGSATDVTSTNLHLFLIFIIGLRV